MNFALEDFALCNPLIVSKILSFLDGQDFLKCRELNSLWNIEVEKAWESKERIYLNIRRFWDKGSKRNFVPSDPRYYYEVPPSFLSSRLTVDSICEFFSLNGVQRNEVKVAHLSPEKVPRPGYTCSLSWIPFPNLRKLILRGNYNKSMFQYWVTWVPFSIPSLKILDAELGGPLCSHNCADAVQRILNGTPNLEELVIRSSRLQPLPRVFPQHLKKVCFSFADGTCSIPDLEFALNEISENLEELNLDVPLVTPFGQKFPLVRLPQMKKLRTFFSADLYPFPIDDSFIGFLQERIPNLESLQIKTSKKNLLYSYLDNAIMSAVNCSSGVHANLRRLSIPQPTKGWVGDVSVETIIKKFTNLIQFSFTNEKRNEIRHGAKLEELSLDLGKLLQNAEEFTDGIVTLKAADGFQIKAHKLLLAARSDYFRAAFFGGVAKTGDVIMTSMTTTGLKMFLHFVYTGKFPSADWISVVQQLLEASRFYNVKSLANIIEEEFTQVFTRENTGEMFFLTRKYGLWKAQQKMHEFILENGLAENFGRAFDQRKTLKDNN